MGNFLPLSSLCHRQAVLQVAVPSAQFCCDSSCVVTVHGIMQKWLWCFRLLRFGIAINNVALLRRSHKKGGKETGFGGSSRELWWAKLREDFPNVKDGHFANGCREKDNVSPERTQLPGIFFFSLQGDTVSKAHELNKKGSGKFSYLNWWVECQKSIEICYGEWHPLEY